MRYQLAIPNHDFLVAGGLQPDLHDARLGDDVPRRRAVPGSGRDLLPAADAGRARPAVPAPVGLRLLVLRHRRRRRLRQHLLPRRRPKAAGSCTRRSPASAFQPGIGADIWLLGLSFVEIASLAAAVELIIGVLKTRPPGMSINLDPAVRLVHPGDRRDDPVRLPAADRGRHPARAGARCSTGRSSIRSAAAIRSCGSTCSGSSAIPRSTSSSCPRSAWSR